ncbi:MAG: TetR/AcrR family transcriptional regulator [Clostridia bacterium]|nr:TetR/AcrR family transcriptional regulator [Clostridia bacterium]
MFILKGRCFILKQRNAECSRSKILDVAEVEFANSGLFGASVNIIAEKAELNKRMIYHYFDSKEGLYQEVLKVNFNKIFELEKNAFSLNIHEQKENLSQKIPQSIRQGIADYYNFLKKNPNYVKLITREELAGGPYIHKLIPDTFLLGFEKLLQIYELGVKNGILKKGLDIMQIIISINAMCFIPFTRQEMLKEIWGADYDQKLEERLEHITNMILKEITENTHITEGDAN